MSRTKTPWPRPGTCTSTSKKNKRYTIAQGNQSREFSSVPNSYESRLNFIKHHSLMDNNIPSYFDSQFPFYVKTSLSERLSTIEVDPNIVLQDSRNGKMKHSSYDLIFVGTTTGRVLKFFNNFSSNRSKHAVKFYLFFALLWIPEIALSNTKLRHLHLKILVSLSFRQLISLDL